MLTRITERKILCVYIHVYRVIKNGGPGLYNSLMGKFGHVLAEKKVTL